ncbi:MAG TPA: aminotransferase class V-fold PLP-dependent enzyme [Acidobacteriaceae bacterium]|jgi:kynureninase|nr:aminotransferase class V-fold PLP-dependent enzyme [Acidobacteriaceae bacterium]
MNIANAVAALGNGALTEEALRRHILPLFSRTLASPGIYLANHSLGRPLDQTEDDLREGFAYWQTRLHNAWDGWQQEEQQHRARIAQLIGARRPDCIIPKVSAGQGLRTVLNALSGTPRVLSTTSEFDSVDIILKQYAAVGRIRLESVSCHALDGTVDLAPLFAAAPHAELVIVSQVLFTTGQVVPDLDRLADACHQRGGRLLVDAYHAIGVISVDVAAIRADFVIGGSYKYLRGGPGAAFLFISPDALDSGLQPIDIGWFAKEMPFVYDRPDPPRFAPGGDAFLESTPPVLTYYQARAGQQLTLALGVDRIRAYALDRLGRLKRYLAEAGITAIGADDQHGAFLTIEHAEAAALADKLEHRGITTDARGRYLRLSPDYLTTDSALREAANAVASCIAAEVKR